MSKPYSILREKMKPAARKKAAEKTKILLDAMPLQELRHARNLSQRNLSMKMRHLRQQFSVAPDRYLVAPVC